MLPDRLCKLLYLMKIFFQFFVKILFTRPLVFTSLIRFSPWLFFQLIRFIYEKGI